MTSTPPKPMRAPHEGGQREDNQRAHEADGIDEGQRQGCQGGEIGIEGKRVAEHAKAVAAPLSRLPQGVAMAPGEGQDADEADQRADEDHLHRRIAGPAELDQHRHDGDEHHVAEEPDNSDAGRAGHLRSGRL
jgi:hypothetical protein